MKNEIMRLADYYAWVGPERLDEVRAELEAAVEKQAQEIERLTMALRELGDMSQDVIDAALEATK